MRAFNSRGEDIASALGSECAEGEIYSVGLARYSIIFDIANVRIHVKYRADFVIGGKAYSYRGEPIEAPLWRLAGCLCKTIRLVDEFCVQIDLDNGDRIDLFTDESQFEAILFFWPKKTPDQTALAVDVF